ncbi:hypothetical protein [Riemerella columbipharyngis]|uniref:Uncharacterized protein n=1 Tax=Riemerella columbipharyngis TaxID=1071918 RepID=A0A1G7C0C2_9FLAO|nr:hypothetical protein [Riemerella columbipharyngis]SDE32761.1 hypothetical protein SAMN05421544_10715 [Riemerella columbipharyngis]
MKKIAFIFICLLFGFANAQNLDVYYQLTMKPNAKDRTYVEKDLFVLSIRGGGLYIL